MGPVRHHYVLPEADVRYNPVRHGRPSKPKSDYLHFKQYLDPIARAQNPDINQTDFAKYAGAAWRDMPEVDRKPFENAEKADRERYEKEVREWEDYVQRNTRPEPEIPAGLPSLNSIIHRSSESSSPEEPVFSPLERAIAAVRAPLYAPMHGRGRSASRPSPRIISAAEQIAIWQRDNPVSSDGRRSENTRSISRTPSLNGDLLSPSPTESSRWNSERYSSQYSRVDIAAPSTSTSTTRTRAAIKTPPPSLRGPPPAPRTITQNTELHYPHLNPSHSLPPRSLSSRSETMTLRSPSPIQVEEEPQEESPNAQVEEDADFLSKRAEYFRRAARILEEQSSKADRDIGWMRAVASRDFGRDVADFVNDVEKYEEKRRHKRQLSGRS